MSRRAEIEALELRLAALRLEEVAESEATAETAEFIVAESEATAETAEFIVVPEVVTLLGHRFSVTRAPAARPGPEIPAEPIRCYCVWAFPASAFEAGTATHGSGIYSGPGKSGYQFCLCQANTSSLAGSNLRLRRYPSLETAFAAWRVAAPATLWHSLPAVPVHFQVC